MASLQVTIVGVLSKKSEKTNIGQTYEQQPIVVTTIEEYPQDYPIEMVKNTFSYLDSINEGDNVEVVANLRGKKWTNDKDEDKYFLNLSGFRITKK